MALRDADGSLEYAAEALLEDAEESGLLQFLPAATVDAARALAHAATLAGAPSKPDLASALAALRPPYCFIRPHYPRPWSGGA